VFLSTLLILLPLALPLPLLNETLTLLEIVCRTSGFQKYFTRLVRTVDNANLSPHRVMCPALDAAPTNVNGASYALIISYRIRRPREVMGVTCGWNKGSAICLPSDPSRIRHCGPVAYSSSLSVHLTTVNERAVKYFTYPYLLVVVVCLFCSIQCSKFAMLVIRPRLPCILSFVTRIGALLGSCISFLQGLHALVSRASRPDVVSKSFLHLVSCVDTSTTISFA